MQDIETINNY